jgi:ABC-type tungstate transport system permease subunit
MAKVTGIGMAAGDASRITLESMLLNSAETETSHFKKGFLILLNDDDQYLVGYRNAGLKMSEALALVETVKTMILADMGYLPSE